jgi:hypothetical protein
MEIYFNPYPGAAKDERVGMECAVATADALFRLKKKLSNISLSGAFPGSGVDIIPSQFVLIRTAGTELRIGDIIFKAPSPARDKLRSLLHTFSTGKTIETDDLGSIENWIVANIGAAAPILELAAKKEAIALTLPTEPEWRVTPLTFEGRSEELHNLWGQSDIGDVVKHCIDSLRNAKERFAARFEAEFCDGAQDAAPDGLRWEQCGFFSYMERASKRFYAVDHSLIKNAGSTRYGPLLELRCYESDYRIFFVYRKDAFPKVLVGGFYHKSEGGDNSQNKAIQNAIRRIDAHEDSLH